MVRAGEGGYLIDDFESLSCVAIGWQEAGDFTLLTDLPRVKAAVRGAYPDSSAQSQAASAGVIHKFRSVMEPGDDVVSYDPKSREYLVGVVSGDYEFRPGVIPDYGHIRSVKWADRVSRDDLSTPSKNSLGSVITLFEPGESVLGELRAAMSGALPGPEEILETEGAADLRRDMIERAHEFLKDRILQLSPNDLEELIASLLRAMGYRARVTPQGPDRGRDVVASPDGLGLQEPRIAAEVKHRPRQAMGAPDIRSFLGALRSTDRGLFVSSGGFTREAKYEAERAAIPITLIDLDDLASLVTEHYEAFSTDGRALLPLSRVYWPVMPS